ncbi:MAG: iron ABC transporter permease [Chloroflexaceae bacterium]|nr:iron ABC transporter permease [Chloroflexaceae bacterium]
MAELTPPPASIRAVWPRVGVRPLLLAGLLAVLVLLFLLNLALGSVRIPLDAVATILLGGEAQRSTWQAIVLNVRLPRALTAVLAGAALAVGGLHMQTLFRNPLADPFVLGVSAGASLGVALVVLTAGVTSTAGLLAVAGAFNNVGLVVAASVGALAVLTVVLLLARVVQHSVTLLIIGLMIGYLTSALVSLLIHISSAERIQAYIAWSFGSFGGVTWGRMQVLAPAVLFGLLLAFSQTKALNALLLGETYAQSMGLRVQRARLLIIGSASVLAGAVTAFCGPIAFLGIAVPHFCRSLLNTADHRILIPACILLGAACALLVDLVAQLPGSNRVLPLNAVMALVGAPVVVWILLRRRGA